MSSSLGIFDGDDDFREPHTPDVAERLPALTPLLELAHGDGYRWASLDVADLDPPTPLLPYAAS